MSTVWQITGKAVDGANPTRRTLLAGAIYSMWGIIAAALSLPAAVYLLLPPRRRDREEWIDAGDVGSLAPNQPIRTVFRRNRFDGWKVVSEKLTAWVVKTDQGRLIAFGPQCTHLGCAHHWDEARSQFVCPCHNSLFSLDGRRLMGPAPRPLDRYDTKVVGGRLMLGPLRPSKEPLS